MGEYKYSMQENGKHLQRHRGGHQALGHKERNITERWREVPQDTGCSLFSSSIQCGSKSHTRERRSIPPPGVLFFLVDPVIHTAVLTMILAPAWWSLWYNPSILFGPILCNCLWPRKVYSAKHAFTKASMCSLCYESLFDVHIHE